MFENLMGLLTIESLIALIALAAMEIVLGIDNLVFIAILTGRLPEKQQLSATRWGLALAMIMRIVLLFSISIILQLNEPFLHLEPIVSSIGLPTEWIGEEANEVSVKDLILLVGGLFLIAKSVHEIHKKLEEKDEHAVKQPASYAGVIAQILLMDLIFSLDSIITAVGMVPVDKDFSKIWIMVVAVVAAVVVMLVFSGPVRRFVVRHPTIKMLALSFMILIGVMLVAEGVGTHIDKGHIYFAMAFALGVEFLNLRLRTKAKKTAAASAK